MTVSARADRATLLADLTKHEKRVWDALVAGDPRADSDALHEAFLGVYADGFADKAAHIGQLSDGPTVCSYDLTDLQLTTLGPDHAALSYRADFIRTKRTASEAMYVTSIWCRVTESEGTRDWVNIFSQDTPALD